MKLVNIFLLFFFVLGCNNHIVKREIEIPSSSIEWGIKDEPPSISQCDELSTDAQRKTCFQEKLVELIYNNIDFSKIIVEKQLHDTLLVSLLVDKNGKIFYSGLEISLEIKNQLPKIDSILIKAINNLPKILPATKTNIGVQVSTSFNLPLILKTN